MRVRVRVAGAVDVGVIAAKDPRIYFNWGCELRVRAEYELALSAKSLLYQILGWFEIRSINAFSSFEFIFPESFFQNMFIAPQP